jgi:hypothetical protein
LILAQHTESRLLLELLIQEVAVEVAGIRKEHSHQAQVDLAL